MRIQIESTDVITTINGTTCRHWKGTTENGIECDVFVRAIAVRDDLDTSAFETELHGTAPPEEMKRASLDRILR